MNTIESKGEKHNNTSQATWNLDTTLWGLGHGSMYKDLSPQIQRWSLYFSKENIITKQNPFILGGGYWVYTIRDILGLLVLCEGVSTTWATWPDMVHGTTAQKMAAQRPGRFWTSHCFDDSRWLLMNLGLKPVPLEAPWNYLSIHIKNVRNRLRMRLGRHFLCVLLLDSEVDSNLSCFGPPPWGFEPNNVWAFYSIWKTL